MNEQLRTEENTKEKNLKKKLEYFIQGLTLGWHAVVPECRMNNRQLLKGRNKDVQPHNNPEYIINSNHPLMGKN